MTSKWQRIDLCMSTDAALIFDLDGDGDLDVYGHAWDHYQYLHLWRNDK